MNILEKEKRRFRNYSILCGFLIGIPIIFALYLYFEGFIKVAFIFESVAIITASIICFFITLPSYKKELTGALLSLYRYKSIIQNSSDAIVLYNEHGEIVDWSKGAEGVYGYKRDEVVGQYPPYVENKEEFKKLLKKVIEGKSTIKAYRCIRKSKTGKKKELILNLVPVLPIYGNTTGMIEIGQDITQIVEINRKIAHIDKMATIGQLVSGVAHQLNTPLASILLLTQMIEEDERVPEELKDNLKKIEKQVYLLRDVTQKLLRLARPALSQKGPINLSELTLELFELFEKELSKRNVSYKLLCENCDTEALVYGDRSELEQAILNLMHNALDAMPEGGKIIVSLESDEDKVSLSVKDTGTGIPEDVLPHIFEPFYTTKGHEKGTGLGLAIVQRIVEDHGGEISVKTEVGKGSVFTITFPRYKGKENEKNSDS